MRRFTFISAIAGIALAFTASLPAFASSNAADVAHLHVQLVFPRTQLARGAKNEAGLYFKLEPGWHVYW